MEQTWFGRTNKPFVGPAGGEGSAELDLRRGCRPAQGGCSESPRATGGRVGGSGGAGEEFEVAGTDAVEGAIEGGVSVKYSTASKTQPSASRSIR